MCDPHWALVPAPLQGLVIAHYRKDQWDDRSPTREWLAATSAAVAYVAEIEEHTAPPRKTLADALRPPITHVKGSSRLH